MLPIYSPEHGTLPLASPLKKTTMEIFKRWEMFSLRSSQWLSLSLDEWQCLTSLAFRFAVWFFPPTGRDSYAIGLAILNAVSCGLLVCRSVSLKKKSPCAACLVQVLVTVMKKWIKKRHQWKPILMDLIVTYCLFLNIGNNVGISSLATFIP